jgi:hypothetical protein
MSPTIVTRKPLLADGVGVEQGLRGVLVRPVSGVDDRTIAVSGQKMGGARLRVPDDDEIGSHRFQVARGVQQRLALREARCRSGEVDRVGRQTFFGKLEGRTRARRRLDEKVDHGTPTKRGYLLDLAGADLGQRLGRVEDQLDLRALHAVDPE